MSRKLGINKRRLNRNTQQRLYLLNTIAASLLDHGYCVSNLVRLKVARSYFEKLVTRSKQDNLTSFKLLLAKVRSERLVKKLLELGRRYRDRSGGYTRILKLAHRSKGDYSKLGRIELI